MTIDPHDLQGNLDRLEEIEKASARLVTHALLNYRVLAAEIFLAEGDPPCILGEDVIEYDLREVEDERRGQGRTGTVPAVHKEVAP